MQEDAAFRAIHQIMEIQVMCPYCLTRQAKIRYVPVDEEHCYLSRSCDDCQKKVDEAIGRTKLVQRGLLRKYDATL